MATITLSTDTLISYAISDLGLASGDTIQLAGHSLIIDADAVDYPVTIANSGNDANLELRDLGRIKLNATLPASVHPRIDPAHPLPVSAEPGIDGDPFRTPLTANARAEIQLGGGDNMEWGLGGGEAYLPTQVRDGAFFARIDSIVAEGVIFSPQLPLHVGDMLVAFGGSTTTTDNNRKFVSRIDGVTGAVSFTNNNNLAVGQYWSLIAGGVLIEKPSRTKTAANIISGPMSGGCVSVDLNYSGGDLTSTAAIGNVKLQRFVCFLNGYKPDDNNSAFGHNIEANIEQFATNSNISRLPSKARIGEGLVNLGKINPTASIFCQNATTKTGSIVNTTVLSSGTITGNYFSPATASDVTWRLTDRTVPAGSTLRLRCAWMREGSSATRASVAVTDPATWWPQLWPLGGDAIASVEFTGGTAVWRQELLTWRNTATEAVTVRVWECVTGTVGGGYLKVEKVKGGAL